MTSEKPTWRKGDILAMPQDLVTRHGEAVANGCHVFIAQEDPEYRQGDWRYGLRRASEFRPATHEDIARLAQIHMDEIRRGMERLSRLMELDDKIRKQKAAE